MVSGIIWCIVGINCKNWINNTKENFNRCKIKNSRLLVVENGDGIGLWGEPQDDEVVIQSDSGASEYINAGLNYIRKNGSDKDWFMKFDSDDYYGKNRLIQIKEVAKKYHAAGSVNIIIKTPNDKMLLIDDGNREEFLLDKIPHGPTLTGSILYALDFPKPQEKWGEDTMWVNEMRDNGILFGSLPIDGFAYVRHEQGTHTFPIPNDLIRHIWLEKMYDIGKWDSEIIESGNIYNKIEMPHDLLKMHSAYEHLLNIHVNSMCG